MFRAYTTQTGDIVYLIKSHLTGPVLSATLRVTGMTQVTQETCATVPELLQNNTITSDTPC